MYFNRGNKARGGLLHLPGSLGNLRCGGHSFGFLLFLLLLIRGNGYRSFSILFVSESVIVDAGVAENVVALGAAGLVVHFH